jgi:hypothetical protein
VFLLGFLKVVVLHYEIPAEFFVSEARPEVAWSLPVRKKDLEQFKVLKNQS